MANKEFVGRVGGIEKMSLIDFPNQLAAILFYKGCNLRCPYCYNPQLVEGKNDILDSKDVIDFLMLRKGVLDGIVFSGGECTLWGDMLKLDIEFAKSLGYKVKVDTNGQKPDFIEDLIKNELVDYVALDIKTNKINNNAFRWVPELTYKTLKLLMKSGVKFETRTTIHPDVINEEDLSELLHELREAGLMQPHYIQYFFPAPKTLRDVDPKPRKFHLDEVNCHGIEVIERGAERN